MRPEIDRCAVTLRAGAKPEKSKVPSWMCVTGIASGRSSAASTSVKAVSAEQTVDSGAWKGGFTDEMIDGVKTSTLGGVGVFSAGGVDEDFFPIFANERPDAAARMDCALSPGCRAVRAVRRGRNACMERIGWRRCVLKRSAKFAGGMVAIGEVW